MEEILHVFLCNVGRVAQAHGKALVTIQAKRRVDCEEMSTSQGHDKSIILHGNVELGKINVARTTVKNVVNDREWPDLTYDEAVDVTKVGNPSHASIFFWNDERGR